MENRCDRFAILSNSFVEDDSGLLETPKRTRRAWRFSLSFFEILFVIPNLRGEYVENGERNAYRSARSFNFLASHETDAAEVISPNLSTLASCLL